MSGWPLTGSLSLQTMLLCRKSEHGGASVATEVRFSLETCTLQQLREYQNGEKTRTGTAVNNADNSAEQNRVLGYFRDALLQHSSDIHFRIGEKG